jgi:hypothetical protein
MLADQSARDNHLHDRVVDHDRGCGPVVFDLRGVERIRAEKQLSRPSRPSSRGSAGGRARMRVS